jgi:hypothetical protein
MAAFVSGLLGTLGGSLLDHEQQQHAEKVAEVKNRQDALKAFLSSPDLTPEARIAGFKALLAAAPDKQEKGKKGKGKQAASDPLSQFMDMLGGSQGKATSGAGGGPGGGQGATTATPAAPQASPEDSQFAPREGSTPASLAIPPIPGTQATGQPGAQNGAGTTPTNGKSAAPLSVKPMPTQGIFKSQADKDQEQLDFEKRRYEQVVKPEKEAERKALQEREDELIRAGNEREDAKLKAQQQRDDARQLALDTRMKSQEAFQERMATMREHASSDRQMRHDAATLRLTDSKAADALDKQATAERQKNISETLKLMQQQLTSSTGLLKSREAEAEKRGWTSFWKDAPDTQSAMEDVENAKAAITYLTEHKTAAISGKEDMDEVTAKTEDILRNGQPQWSRAAWAQANQGKDVKAAELAAMKAGMKVVP